MRLDHVQLAIPPGTEAVQRAFWCDLLGFEEEPKPCVLAARGGLWLRHGDVRLHLGVEPDHRPARKAHPAFAVAALDGLARDLDAAGHGVTWDATIPDLRRFFADDPSGNRLEFLETS
ncbi:MAG: VOC family protein [Pseudomonadota bacterium]